METSPPSSERRWDVAEVAKVMCLVCICLCVEPSLLEARDPDGRRLGATYQALGESERGSLAPPDDTSNWSYFKLQDERAVTITLRVTSGSGELELALLGGTGDSMVSKDLEGSDITVQKTLKPGMYYLKVTAEAEISYQLSVE